MSDQDYNLKQVLEEIEMKLIVSMKRTFWEHQKDEALKNFDWPQWQALKIKSIRDFRKQNKELFKNYNNVATKGVYEQMKKQFREGAAKVNKEAIKAGILDRNDAQLGGSFFGLNDRKLKALAKSVASDMVDVKSATLRKADDVYRSTIYKAQVYANTGAGTITQAIDMATKDFLKSGFNCIVYKNGSKHNIADYADMAVRTANKRANLMGEGEMRKSIGNPLVYISKHGTSCGKCDYWAGKVYIDDVWSGGTAHDGNYPLLSTAIAGGLFHPRCRHGASTYFEGLDEGLDVQEVQEQTVSNEEKQYRRLIAGSLNPDNIEKYKEKLKDLKRS